MKKYPFFLAVIVVCTASCNLAANPATANVTEAVIIPTDLPAATDTPTATPVPPTATARPTPRFPAGQIAAGGVHTCALFADGGVKCWGSNVNGALGDGTLASHIAPEDVSGLTGGVTAVTAGSDFACALLVNGGVKCWGDSQSGQLGSGISGKMVASSHPREVSGLSSGVLSLSAGNQHACAVLITGAVKCWGYNRFGQLGDGTTESRNRPVAVSGLSSGAVAVSAGALHTCALMSDGGVKCWGYNLFGKLGNWTLDDSHIPKDVEELAGKVKAVSAGYDSTCALLIGGLVQCWGSNVHGELGSETGRFSRNPKTVSDLSGAIAVSVGKNFACALTSGGSVKCWGLNDSGQLGDGTMTDRNLPVNVSGLPGKVQWIDAGSWHACAVLSDGGMMCWGGNASGQLGDWEFTDSAVPVDVRFTNTGPS